MATKRKLKQMFMLLKLNCWGYNEYDLLLYCFVITCFGVDISFCRMIRHQIRRSRAKKRSILKIKSKWIDRSVLTICLNRRKFLRILWQIRAQNRQPKPKPWAGRRKIKMLPTRESKLKLWQFRIEKWTFSI